MKGGEIRIKDKTNAKESLKVTPFRKEIRTTNPHRHNSYFEIIFLSAGSGFHAIDNFKYRITPPIIFLVRKEQLHQFELENEGDGFVAIIKKEFLERSLDPELKRLIEQLSAYQCVAVDNGQQLFDLFQMLSNEMATLQSQKNDAFVEGILKAIIAKILDAPLSPVINYSEKNELYENFLALLRNGQHITNSVQQYASILNTSPQNLNAACRKAVDQSAAEVIADALIAEAKRLLIYTSNTVAEVAFKLNFTDASNFVKYFKRNTGTTPLLFKKSI